MPLARVAAAILCIAAMTAASGAQTVTSKSYSYFSVGGKTAADLDRELSTRGPVMESTGTRHPGATQMRFGAKVEYLSSPGRCAINGARITLHTKIILPNWTARERAGKGLAVIWDTLSRDIKRHEERHAEIARQYAKQLETSLTSLRPERNCGALRLKVNAKTKQILAAHQSDQARFDRTESASFKRRMVRMLRFKAEAMSQTE